MPTIRQLGVRTRYAVERFDGGYNSKDAPSRISPYESPDCLNVVFDDRGGVETRPGTRLINQATAPIGNFKIDGGIEYVQSMYVFAGGGMYRMSITTDGSGGISQATYVTIASSYFSTGTPVAATVYQNVLFMSDGINGPYKYTSGGFYKMGIAVPSAPAASGTSAGSIATGTYYYRVSFVNSQLVEGEAGSCTAGVTIATTSTIGVTAVPVGTSLAGVNARRIYRSTEANGIYKRVGEINDNTTTTFIDTTSNDDEGQEAIEDGSSPTPFTTISLAKERLFFDDSADRSLLRYTNYENPYVSESTNFEPLDKGDGEYIIATAFQDDLVTAFKENNIFTLYLADPADDTTWQKFKSPANIGIVGPKALAYIDNNVVFMGRQNKRLTGLHILSGQTVVETSDGRVRTNNISEKIEYDLLRNIPMSAWSNISFGSYERRLFASYRKSSDSFNKSIFWLDLNRLGADGQPGSWAPWRGIDANVFFTYNGRFYAGSSDTDSEVLELLQMSSYADKGAAIDSYFWTKEIGGEREGALDSYTKDFRLLSVWHAKLGDYRMNVKWRLDGDGGSGFGTTLNLNPLGSLWLGLIWGSGVWGGGSTEKEEQIPLGKLLGKRIQVRFDNQNTVNQGFKVYRLFVDMNLRRYR